MATTRKCNKINIFKFIDKLIQSQLNLSISPMIYFIFIVFPVVRNSICTLLNKNNAYIYTDDVYQFYFINHYKAPNAFSFKLT